MKARTFDELGYAVHTNNELPMMLVGEKPLAMFHAVDFELPNEDFVPEVAFAPHVASGMMVRDSFELDGGFAESIGRDVRIVHVLFALRDEAWRIPAMRLLLSQHSRTKEWNETCERMEGALLGYSDEQNDEWCEARFAS